MGWPLEITEYQSREVEEDMSVKNVFFEDMFSAETVANYLALQKEGKGEGLKRFREEKLLDGTSGRNVKVFAIIRSWLEKNKLGIADLARMINVDAVVFEKQLVFNFPISQKRIQLLADIVGKELIEANKPKAITDNSKYIKIIEEYRAKTGISETKLIRKLRTNPARFHMVLANASVVDEVLANKIEGLANGLAN